VHKDFYGNWETKFLKTCAKGSARSSKLLQSSGPDVTLAQPPQHQEKWNQRKHEKEGPAATVDYTVNHLRAYIHTEKPDHEDAKSVP
jgi:hypothetical protein